MDEEFNALINNKTWDLVCPPTHKNVVGRWTYKTKRNPDDTINKYKATLVAKDYTQQYGFDFTETFSPLIKPSIVRLVLTIGLYKGWNISQLDINNAFLNGILEEEIYIKQPPGYEQNTNLVCKLNKAIYGFK